MLNDNLKNQFHLHFIVFIWGFTALLGDLISLQALPLVWTRIFIAIACIYGYILFKKKSILLSGKTIARLMLYGIVIALHWFTFFYAIKVSNISITLACISTGAFFTSLLEPIFFKRKMVWYEVFLGCLVVCGLVLIFSFETQYIEGIIFSLISAFLSASFSIINGKLATQHDSVIISFYELIGGWLFLGILMLAFGQFQWEFFQFQPLDFLWLFILGSICTAYPFIATIDIMKYLSPYTVMLSINMEPIYGTILAVLVFPEKEMMTAAFYLGALIIIGTVILNAYFKQLSKKKLVNTK